MHNENKHIFKQRFISSAIEYNTLDLDILKSIHFDVDEDQIL